MLEFYSGEDSQPLAVLLSGKKKETRKNTLHPYISQPLEAAFCQKYFSQIPSVATSERSHIAVSTREYGELQEGVKCLLLQFFNAVKPRNSQKTRWRKWAKFQFNSHFKRKKRRKSARCAT